jgi:uncharacterized protein (TIGR02145 family)
MKKINLLLLLLFTIVSLFGQDYRISFAGTGESNQVSKVTVENMTQGKSLTLNGTEVLHLGKTITGIYPISDIESEIHIYPNPTNGTSTVNFVANTTGKVNFELFDITGKRLGTAQNILKTGTHSYLISNLGSGIFTVRISSQSYNYTVKLVSNGTANSDVKVKYIGNETIQKTSMKLKSAYAEKEMQYNTGDRLKITGTSGRYSTVVTDVPTQGKLITFPFMPCTDADGNNYPVVKIGTQIWMAENLKTTMYCNGDPIPNVTDDIEWRTLKTGAYCNYNNDTNIGNKFGKLYNWHAVNDSRRIAPVGWHVPSNQEWTTLSDNLGGSFIAGGKLKEKGIENWTTPNTGATNESGFTALPGGMRTGGQGEVGNPSSGGNFIWINNYGLWYTSTEYSNIQAIKRILQYDQSYIDPEDPFIKESGYSVRCVMDANSQNAVIPTLTTTKVSKIATTILTCGGNITSDGGAYITDRGICLATTPNPTKDNKITMDGSDTGDFNSDPTNLVPSTLYYIRAYATNSAGTAYGNQISCTTVADTVVDIDGNVYHTVTIGTQVWMVENLKTTRFNDGINIPNVTDDNMWAGLTTPGLCWYNNDAQNNITYGALYNWYAVNTGKIAPKGWHIPSDYEWRTLTNYLGGKNIAGGKLKAFGVTLWLSPNTDATNESGYTALPGGTREVDRPYFGIQQNGYWWSSTIGQYRYLGFDNTRINSSYDWDMTNHGLDKKHAFSIRCVMDY